MTQEQTCKPVVLMTGSGRGIGLEMAKALANQGFNSIIHGRSDSQRCKAPKPNSKRVAV
jgi:NAD(P)-dependent dehydrogenase (short-subunit alcohol dehydrogenase family)